ncbi:MAG: DUF512 domain-containing protein [Clostridia bacterium]|nr:DUF512 domain-containing protein [Clostridia bacterium]
MVNITAVEHGSKAEKSGIFAGDVLISVNGREINDVLDYRFYLCERALDLELKRGEQKYRVKIRKNEYDDIGLDFSSFLMDEKRRCANNCVFCFIDQNPKGMRDTIYFKDDDTRLSFLQGSYITMTNLGERDIKRIVDMKTSPINISVHTTNPELRCQMLKNKNAGKVLNYIKTLDEGGITMNFQIVLCKGLNDGEELDRSMRELSEIDHIGSVSIVPVGLTKHREGLCRLEGFDSDDAARVIEQVEAFAEECERKRGEKLFFCSDEFYLSAGRKLHDGEYYDGYPQIENGVGMITSSREEFDEAFDDYNGQPEARNISIATGVSAYGFICSLAEKITARFPQVKIKVYKIINEFFGESVTVAGLITGRDLAKQLDGKDLGEELLLAECMLRYEGDLFLCGMSLGELSEKLNVKITKCSSDGWEMFSKMIGE